MTLDTSLLGEEVPLAKLGKAVRSLWAEENGAGKTRASLMNFAIYSEDLTSLEANTHLLASIARENACRALLILNDATAEETTTRAWITAHCQLYDGKRSVCCEQLSFLMTGGTADRVRNVVFSNLESDLPLVLWWQGELSDRLDERFCSVIDGLIVDSSHWQDAGSTMQRVLAARENRKTHFTLGDLSWMRSHVMRVTLAAAFQNQTLLAALPSMDKLMITHAPGYRAAGLLVAAWIGKQLHCTFRSQDGKMIFERQSGSPITIELMEGEANGCPLQALELSGAEGSVAVTRECGSGFVHARTMQGAAASEEVQPAPRDNDADLIVDQLSRFGGTTRYFEVMPLFLEMAR
jgi:glucose-6-phosphate dehydrogenase assembly protein OpcA